MVSRTIKWHKQCFINKQDHLLRLVSKVEALQLDVLRITKEQEFHSRQIDEAERLGKEKFDSNRFLVKSK